MLFSTLQYIFLPKELQKEENKQITEQYPFEEHTLGR